MGISAKPYLFSFWSSSGPMPAYIRLCRDSLRANLSDAFEIIDLDFDSCIDWVSERDLLWQAATPLTEGRSHSHEGRHIAQFTGMLRAGLLARHGGLWVDADQIAFGSFAHLAPLAATRDLVVGEDGSGQISNPVLGARPGSGFAETLWQVILTRIAEKQAAGEQGARWGEMGFRLLSRIWADTPPERPFVAPFGTVITGDTEQPSGVFAPGSGVRGNLPPLALGLSVFNNALGDAPRAMTIDELRQGDTLFALAERVARGSGELDDWLMVRGPDQLAALDRSLVVSHQMDAHIRQQQNLSALRTKLNARNTQITKLKANRATLIEKQEKTRDRIQSLKANNADLKANLQARIGIGQQGRQGRSTVFTEIYDKGLWYSGGSHSGCGSSLRQTEHLRPQLPQLLRDHDVTSLLDIPCGDFNWMQHVDLTGIDYTGADIVPELIDANQQYARSDRRFMVCDLVEDPLPKADCVLVRDCFSHLILPDCLKALSNIHRSGARFLLITHYRDETENKDITTGHFHRLNFCLPPFDLPAPTALLVENHPNPKHADKCLGLWPVTALNDIAGQI